jgi:hypothetical protein
MQVAVGMSNPHVLQGIPKHWLVSGVVQDVHMSEGLSFIYLMVGYVESLVWHEVCEIKTRIGE